MLEVDATTYMENLRQQHGGQGPTSESAYYLAVIKVAENLFHDTNYMLAAQERLKETVAYVPGVDISGDEGDSTVDGNEDLQCPNNLDSNSIVSRSGRIYIPDFTLVYVDPRDAGGTRNQQVVACVEVKRNAAEQKAAERQIKEYLRVYQSKCTDGYEVRGMLILGEKTYVFNSSRRLPTPGGQGLSTAQELQNIFETQMNRHEEYLRG